MMWKYLIKIICFLLLVCLAWKVVGLAKRKIYEKHTIKSFFQQQTGKRKYVQGTEMIKDNDKKETTLTIQSKTKEHGFEENFDKDYVLEETGIMSKSASEKWWVNSGAFLYSENGVGRTIMGKLNKKDRWRIDYRDYNSDETDNGYRPQNIFRLVTRTQWKNFNQEVYFRIKKYNLSRSKHRFESNGILLFNRYQDGDNLYYTGLRVDGAAVIKKKYKGKYYLLGYEKILMGKYDRKSNPNLIPENVWVGVKSEVKTTNDSQVAIKVFVDIDKTGNWEKVLDVIDNGKKYGGKAILKSGYAGIRTDFMDVEFDNYKIEEME